MECTWDETPRDRLAITMKKYTEEDLKSSNFKSILASGSEDENEEDNDANKTVEKEPENDSKSKTKKNKKKNEEDDGIQKYKDLLFGQDEKFRKKRDADMEFSWEGGVEDDDFDEDDDDDLLVSKKSWFIIIF